MFPFGGHGFGLALGPFEANYRCYPVTFIDKPEAETGDKIFLPPSALDRLCESSVLGLFKLCIISHALRCGVE